MSKSNLGKQTPNVPKHSHCQYCGLPVSVNEEFCSEECQGEYAKFMKNRRNRMLLTAVPVFVLVVIIILGYFLRSGG
jgi:predicted nucleic acid-binding Zn ribbon protein